MPARSVEIQVRILVAVAAALAVAALWLRLDGSALAEVGRYRDDAYYFLVWARNLAEGRGPVVSDGVATSGVHLGWGLALAGWAWAFGGASLVAAAQGLGLGLHLATAALVGALLPVRSGWVRALVAALYLGNPLLLTEAQNGQETALACCALAVLIAARRARPLWFVLASVLAVAARSDLGLFVAFLSLWRRGEPLSLRLAWPLFALAAYSTWNLLLAGETLQDSALPIPWLVHDRFAQTGPDLAARLSRLWWFGRPSLLGGPFALGSAAGSAVLAQLALATALRGRALRIAPAVAVAGAWAAGASDLVVPALAAAFCAILPRPGRALRRGGWPLLGGAFALAVVHYAWREYPRPYYFAPLAVAGLWSLGMVAGRLGPRAVLLLGTAAILGQALQLTTPAPRRAWQEPMSMAGRFVDRFVPGDARIGCFNAGLVTWLRPGPVVNLDGVVNRAAFDALRAGQLSELLDELDVRYIVDNPVQVAVGLDWPHACGEYFGAGFDPARDLRELARFVVPGADAGRPGTGSFRLWARARIGGEVRPRPAASIEDLGPAPDGGRYVAWRGEPGQRLRWGEIGREGDAVEVIVADDAGVVMVVKLPAAAPGTRALFTSGHEGPIMEYRQS